MRNMAEVEINVGGTIFLTTFQTLSKIKETRLSSLKRDIALDKCIAKFFFDRNPEIFNSILDLYRTGELHFPSNFCGATIRNELEFWEIDKKYVSECCLASLYRHDDELEILKEIKNLQNGKALDIPKEECRDGCWRDYLWKVLQYPATSRKASVFSIVYLLMVLVSTTVLFLNTKQDLREPKAAVNNQTDLDPKTDMYAHTSIPWTLSVIDLTCGVFFTLEFFIRFIVTPTNCRQFLCSASNIADAIAIFSFWIFQLLMYIGPIHMDSTPFTLLLMIFGFLRLLQLCRFYRFLNRFQSFDVINLAARASCSQCSVLIVVFTLSNLFFGYLVYHVEFYVQNSFDNALVGIWWAVVTMTTVGYGDVVPKWYLGQIVAIFCALTGILILAMPVAIVTSNFTVYYTKLKQYSSHKVADKIKSGNESKVKLKRNSICKSIAPMPVLTVKSA